MIRRKLERSRHDSDEGGTLDIAKGEAVEKELDAMIERLPRERGPFLPLPTTDTLSLASAATPCKDRSKPLHPAPLPQQRPVSVLAREGELAIPESEEVMLLIVD
jgi:hypothetical protein